MHQPDHDPAEVQYYAVYRRTGSTEVFFLHLGTYCSAKQARQAVEVLGLPDYFTLLSAYELGYARGLIHTAKLLTGGHHFDVFLYQKLEPYGLEGRCVIDLPGQESLMQRLRVFPGGQSCLVVRAAAFDAAIKHVREGIVLNRQSERIQINGDEADQLPVLTDVVPPTHL